MQVRPPTNTSIAFDDSNAEVFPAAKYLYAVKLTEVDPPSITVCTDSCEIQEQNCSTAGQVLRAVILYGEIRPKI